ncbi:MAG: zinc-ribbon domain-containing protein [Promethearchaeota archaeon]
MTTTNPTGYCPHCQQNVLLTREDIDWPLAILLLCFTGGIGFIIYLIIYYNKPENRCVHCNSVVNPISAPNKNIHEFKTILPETTSDEINPYKISNKNSLQVKEPSLSEENVEKIESEAIKYCPFCGERLMAENYKFCPSCGTKL